MSDKHIAETSSIPLRIRSENNTQKLRCYLIGEGTLLLSCSEYLIEQGHEICGIISANPLIAQWAGEQKITLTDPGENWIETLKKVPFDYLFSIYSFSLIPDEVLLLPRRQAVNFHDSLLPKYAGFYATSWAIIKGEKQHGVSWHLMTPKADAGGIIKQQVIDIGQNETALEINMKCYQAGIQSFAELIDDFVLGTVDIKEQNPALRSYFSRYKRLPRGGIVSWKTNAEEIHNLIRALDFGPYPNALGVAKFLVKEEFFIIKACSLIPSEKKAQPGEVVNINDHGIQVATENGDILLEKILTIEGEILSIGDFVARVGLHKGMGLTELDAQITNKIDVVLKKITPQETAWLKQWENYQPLRLNWHDPKNTLINFSDRTIIYETLPLKIPPKLAAFLDNHHSENYGDFLAIAFFYYLAEISQQSCFDIGYGDQKLIETFNQSMGFFVPYVPLRVDNFNKTFAEFLSHCQTTLKSIRQKYTYTRDIRSRYHSLQFQTASKSLAFPIVVLQINNPEDYQPAAGNAIFLIDNQKLSGYFKFNLKVLERPEAEKFVRNFELFLINNLINNHISLLNKASAENESDQDQVDKWRLVYNQVYEEDRNDPGQDPFFNIKCWKDSYTGNNISDDEMREWVDCTIQRIQTECSPSRILEIGCGTGMLLSRLLPEAVYYYGTDFSENAIAYIQESYHQYRDNIQHLELSHRTADDFSAWPEQSFDTAILNSVIQYFPSLAYLKKVIKGVVEKLDSEGKCFIGDVRNALLLPVYHSAVALFKASKETTLEQLRKQIQIRETQEEELCVKPEFFLKIAEEFPEVNHVEVLLKTGNSANELTKFRYDVVIHLGEKKTTSVEIPWLDWRKENLNRQRVQHILRHQRPQYLGIASIPNSRLAKDVMALNYIKSANDQTVEDLRHLLKEQETTGEDPQDWQLLAQEEDYTVALNWLPTNTLGDFNVIFRLPTVKKTNINNFRTVSQSTVTLEEKYVYPVKEYTISTDYPRDKRTVDLFAEQVQKQPNATALVYKNQKLTYQELAEETEQLAIYIRSQGVKAGDLIGLFVQPSPEMLIVLLGVMKAGAAYLPLDPSYPQERITYILEDAQVPWVITQKELAENLPPSNSRTLYVEDRNHTDQPEQQLEQEENPPYNHGDSLAYVIYTSGSTGKPKGVAIEHHSLTNFLYSMAAEFNCGQDDYLLALTTFCFDISALELYLPLISGGCLEVLPSEVPRDGLRLREKIESSDSITIMQATPASWQMLLAAGWEPKKPLKLLCGGEALSAELTQQLLKPEISEIQLWNLYGPTETTIWSTLTRINPGEQVTIGRPIANTQCYILDENQNPVADGELGELYIGGEGVARGYLGRPEETEKKFVSNPFTPAGLPRLYRTGDLVKRLPDERIIYAGRIDFQVKLRGFRIELGEIESTLRKLENVDDAVVVLREDGLDQRLVAFVLYKPGCLLPRTREWATELKAWLPEYMIPSSFIVLKSFPQTLNRKIDRKCLSTDPLNKLKEDYGLAEKSFSHVLEQDLRQIAARVLKLEPTSLDANLNMGEYGYNSLRFTNLSVQLNKTYKIQTNPTMFYQHSSIKKIAKYLEDNFRETLTAYYQQYLQTSTPDSAPSVVKKQVLTLSDQEQQPTPSIIIDDAIAIIGIGGILPGGNTLTAFWDSLLQGKDMIRELPPDRYDGDYYRQKMQEIGVNQVLGGFIDNVDQFDAAFFGLSPREAELMDPRQRLLLQTVWETIEDSGHKPADFSGQEMGVFIGTTGSDYWELQQQRKQNIDGYTLSGYSTSVIANRISYLFNFKGPSLVIDTACSSSLMAVHRAIQALKTNSCKLALAGGVNLMLSPLFQMALAKGGYLSEDGRCKTFDRSANGYVRGEGVGMVLLRPLNQALADGDPVYAVIRGSAENHSGRTNSLTAPSVDSQKDLLIAAYEQANIDPDSLGYIEVHGTGTSLGDPIEINALKEAFQTIYQKWGKEGKGKNHHCGLGALKTNIGHLESAAGIASLLKVVLAMKSGRLPKSLHFQEQNPYIDLQQSPFHIIKDHENWQRPQDDAGRELPRRAGVSSFGFGGANVHLVLEEYLHEQSSHHPQPGINNSQSCLAVLSAKNEQQLKAYAQKLADFLNNQTENHDLERLNLRDITYTLQVGRESMTEKAAWVVSGIEELRDRLSAYAQGKQEDLCIRGNSESGKKVPTFEGKEGVAFIQNLAKGQLWQDIACLWVLGCLINWEILYPPEDDPQRLHLPTYPFAKDSYWLPNITPQNLKLPNISPVRNHPDSHPLIQGQVSTDGGQIFTSILRADAFYLSDHIVDGEKVLPGVATIEMARIAAEMAADKKVRKIRQIIWARPILVNDATLNVELHWRRTDQAVMFEIRDQNKGAIYTQGKVVYEEELAEANPARSIDIDAIRQRCSQNIKGEEIYAKLRIFGLELGSGFQPLQELFSNGTEALSTLQLPPALEEDANKFMLHPSLMDGALQTVLGGPWGLTSSALHIPYTIGEVEIFGSVAQSCYVYAVSSEQGTATNNRGFGDRYDAYILDQTGKELVRIKNFLLRPFKYENKPSVAASYVLDDQALLDATIKDLVGMAAAILKMPNETIVITKNMSDYGFDSISFMELVNPINATFGLEITPDLFFEHSSLDQLAKHLCQEFRSQLIAHYQLGSEPELLPSFKYENKPSVAASYVLDDQALLDATIKDLVGMAAAILKMPEETVVITKNMSDYGFDSISFMELVNPINATFGLEITPDLFFEHSSLDQLAKHLCQEFRSQLIAHYQLGSTPELLQPDHVNAEINQERIYPNTRELQNPNEPIAIIGISGIIAGAQDLESFWQGLVEGKDWIVEIPPSRWDWQTYYGDPMTEDNKTKSKWGGFMTGVDAFDAAFFGISPHEARLMDPQQRFFLQAVWKMVENAGLQMSALSGTKTGVFVGVANTDYGDLLKAHAPSVEAHTSTGTCPSVLANRISYLFNLRGPSLPVDTACSSSLVAVNYAVESIRNGSCDMAIAGGVNIILTPHFTLSFSKSGMLSEDGRCKTFDSRADGYARGEGVGAILLKPLKQAEADGNIIHAVIRSTAVNHGGHANSLTAPDPNSQAQVLIDAYEKAGIDPATVSYIEAHGTGTSLGDPIEINGLKKSFTELQKRWGTPIPQPVYCGIGSVKTQTGHLEAAAGIAGILKVVLSMKYGKLPGILHFQKLNPFINLTNSPFYIVDQTRNWERLRNIDGQPLLRRAGVSSFGFGGVNAHVVLEEYQEKKPSSALTNPHQNQDYLIVLSAKNKERLGEVVKNLFNYLTAAKLQTHSRVAISDIAYTLQVGREGMPERLALVVSNIEDLIKKLDAYQKGVSPIAGVFHGIAKPSPTKLESKSEISTNSSLVQPAVQQKALEKVAQLWISGSQINWNLLYPQPPQRIELPTYPFAKTRYWLPTGDQEENQSPSATISNQEVETRFLKLYRPEWIPQSLEVQQLKDAVAARPSQVTSKKILVVTPPGGVWLESLLAQAHTQDEILLIKLGDIHSPQEWLNRLGRLDHLDTIYFLGGIQHFGPGDDLDQLEQSQELGVFSLFRLLKALQGRLMGSSALSLKVITCGVHCIPPDTNIYPFAASMNGMGMTIAREYPSLKVSCFDIDPHALDENYPQKQREFILQAILAEPAHERGQEIVLRAGQRYVRTLHPLVLPSLADDHLRTNGVYVILGGMGGIGLTLSQYLAANYQARLILIGRSQLDDQKKAQIVDIESRGGSVFYGQADATDLDGMKQVIAQAKARFGSIHGVFHSALILEDKSLAAMDEDTFRVALEPKVKGSVVLHDVVREEDLDFMMFFSSIQTFMGNPGQSNYGAACAFKDAYAHYLHATKTCPVYIINWGYWGSVGIVAQKSYQQRLAKQGIYSIEPDEGMEAIRRLLGATANQAIAMKSDNVFAQSLGVDCQYHVELLPESKSIPSLIATLAPTITQSVTLDAEVLKFRQALIQLEQWAARFLLQVWQEMGGLDQTNLRLLPQYYRLYDCILDILSRAGLTQIDPQGNISLRQDNGQHGELYNLETEKQQLLSNYPNLKAHIRLLEKCLSQFGQILTGQCLATDVMFPRSSMDLVEGIYKGHPIANHFNQLVTDSLVAYILARLQQRKGDEKITILEIGAGTGGTSAVVLKAIAPYSHLIRYIYTDISLAFVNYGREQFEALYPFAEFRVLNIEKEVSNQGFNIGSVDVVLATNVLHATQNIRRTLAHTKVLLKKHGWLILNEATTVQDFATLTFGLLSGWWLYEDETFRLPGAPLLSTSMWENVLEKEGFHKCIFLNDKEDFANLRQHLIISESNGLIKQRIGDGVAGNNNVELIPLSVGITHNLRNNEPQRTQRTQRNKSLRGFLRKSHSATSQSMTPVLTKRHEQKEELQEQKDLSNRTKLFLQKMMAEILKMPWEEIDADTAFVDYGMDSILLNRFNYVLQQEIGVLSKSLLLEYQTVGDLTDYLLSHRRTELVKAIGGSHQDLELEKTPDKTPDKTLTIHNNRDILHADTVTGEDIAIVGLNGRYPQAENLDQFWDNLKSNTVSITEIPRERWDYRDFYDIEKGRENKIYCKRGGFLTDIDKFDPIFFGITPLEAKTMNPEERIMLEVVWATLEDAGYLRQTLNQQKVGVYIGANALGYPLTKINGNTNTAIDLTTYNLPNRISYFFNFTGPSMAIDTSCSSSLTAVHLACESIRRGECNAAIAGGINLYLHPSKYMILSQFKLLSSQPSYSLFSQDGDGFIPGEGAGAVLLKSLRQAEQDKDHIYGVIKASAMLHKGRSNDFLLPSPQAQESLVKQVIKNAGFSAESISYFESQAMGSAVVDSAEWAGISRAYRSLTDKTKFCAYGSVKPNIGHLETASGIAQLTKVLLQMKHQQLLPTRFSSALDPAIELENSPFYLQRELSHWQKIRVKKNGSWQEIPRRAAISSGGGGGMLSHMIVEEYQ
ncbi:amino acid adenylation domain-containing protein [Anabaena sp. UHCC 0451]|uniref:amino acid adenylation domain-containing protein n=1 Tax=Anabaena sp. UHCC 0451 TaxID=2055235 RepID=UPI002B20478F|nr:amino acid adenylation domain-containing protein [Anabaena sp. UHCC 0451]MEA5576036.1 amino acid adenylation domain-containing protein [Anabaena sp. UHCC 0451]